MTPEQLTEDLKTLLGSNLHAVILYGSAASGDQTKHYSNINILVVVGGMNVTLLELVSPVVKKWRKDGNPAPLFLTAQTIESSLDVFPIEFMDMKASHRVLFGNDAFKNIVINNNNLRHQLEYELRGKLILLETGFLEAEGKESMLHDLMSRSLSSVTALFNATLRLIGEKPAEKKRDVWNSLNAKVPIDVAAFEEILNVRESKKASAPARELYSKLHASLQRVTEFVNQSH